MISLSNGDFKALVRLLKWYEVHFPIKDWKHDERRRKANKIINKYDDG